VNVAWLTSTNDARAKAGDRVGSNIDYDPDSMFPNNNKSKPSRPPVVALAHELLGHSWDWDQGRTSYGVTENGIPLNEIDAINIENRMRRSLNIPLRTTFGAKEIDPKLLD
jgi:hypothetical protein